MRKSSIVLYILAGLLVFGGLVFLFRKTGVPLPRLFSIWFPDEFTVVTLPLWPITAALSLSLWGVWYFDLKLKERKMKKREEEARKGPDPYSHMSMEELLAEQRRVMDWMRDRK